MSTEIKKEKIYVYFLKSQPSCYVDFVKGRQINALTISLSYSKQKICDRLRYFTW